MHKYAHSLTNTRMHLCVWEEDLLRRKWSEWRSKRDGNTIRSARAPLVRLLRRPKINWRSTAAERGPKATTTSNRLQPNRLSNSWQRDAQTCSLAMRSMWARVVVAVARLTLVGFVSFSLSLLFLFFVLFLLLFDKLRFCAAGTGATWIPETRNDKWAPALNTVYWPMRRSLSLNYSKPKCISKYLCNLVTSAA